MHDTISNAHQTQSIQRTKTRMGKFFRKNQVLGRRTSIGCVALEITQRCNLDCTLCYLSEHSESVKDMPLASVFHRIEKIKEEFGPGTDVQVTGGDPTLRKHDELCAIVAKIRELEMRPTLMTNGILASRKLLERLVDAGLNDLALHVDITQERKGYKTELDLNKVREDYIERARGLPLAIIFNTTVCQDNFQDIPEMIRFFRRHADVVGMASFQLQADTGRGVLKEKDAVISLQSVRKQIAQGAEIDISWDTILIGHPACHKIGITLATNNKLYDLNDDPDLFSDFLEDFKDMVLDRRYPARVLREITKQIIRRPRWIPRAFGYVLRHLWQMKWDLVRSRGKVHKLSFFVQNFMDASALEEERIHACSFMVMTEKGAMSMCAHNAKRDEFILKPIKIEEEIFWDPLTGKRIENTSHAIL